MKKPPKYVNKVETSIHPHHRSENNHVVSSTYSIANVTTKQETVDEAESGNSDIIYSQDLIIRDLNLPAQISSPPNNGFLNFKRFRKGNTQSGNSFNNLIPFSKYPYKDFDYGNQDMLESVKEEKKAKANGSSCRGLVQHCKGKAAWGCWFSSRTSYTWLTTGMRQLLIIFFIVVQYPVNSELPFPCTGIVWNEFETI
ncbi:hypothetical protein OIU76_021745 [Salix suchowensis]|nr:hypothetical protein OIU76_021745 [Salix suchowensis]